MIKAVLMRKKRHVIISDARTHFEKNIHDFYDYIESAGQVVFDVKIRMKTYNSDYSAYHPRYLAVFRTVRTESL